MLRSTLHDVATAVADRTSDERARVRSGLAEMRGLLYTPPDPLGWLMARVLGTESSFGSRIVPPDALAVQMLRLQTRLDPIHNAISLYKMATGEESLVRGLLGVVQRHARRRVIEKVEMGEPLTEGDLLQMAGADLRMSTPEMMQLMSAHSDARYDHAVSPEAMRAAWRDDARAGRDGGAEGDAETGDADAVYAAPVDVPRAATARTEGAMPSAPIAAEATARAAAAAPGTSRAAIPAAAPVATPATARTAPGAHVPAADPLRPSVPETRIAPLAAWLATQAADVLAAMHDATPLAHAAAREPMDYEATAIVWARTLAAEGALRLAELPAAVQAWEAEDRAFRAHGQAATPTTAARAAMVDALGNASTRTRAAALAGAPAPSPTGAAPPPRDRSAATPASARVIEPTPTWSLYGTLTGDPIGALDPATLGRDLDAAFGSGSDIAPATHDDLPGGSIPPEALARRLAEIDAVVAGDDLRDQDRLAAEEAEALVARLRARGRGDVDPLAPVPGIAADATPATPPTPTPEGEATPAGGPETWIDGARIAAAFLRIDDAGIVVRDHAGERTIPGMLHRLDGGPAVIDHDGTRHWYQFNLRTRQDGPAIEAVDPAEDAYYRQGVQKPLELPPTLRADRTFRELFAPTWQRRGWPVQGTSVAASVFPTLPAHVREPLLAQLAASGDPADRTFASAFTAGQGGRPSLRGVANTPTSGTGVPRVFSTTADPSSVAASPAARGAQDLAAPAGPLPPQGPTRPTPGESV